MIKNSKTNIIIMNDDIFYDTHNLFIVHCLRYLMSTTQTDEPISNFCKFSLPLFSM